MEFDIRDHAELAQLMRESRPDVVIHTAGEGSVDAVEREPDIGRQLIFQPSIQLADMCRETGAQFVYLSSNAVFDGQNAPYDEEAELNPLNRYGAIKMETELAVQEILPEVLIIRPILSFGWPMTGQRGNPLTLVLEKLRKNERLSIVNDVFENAISSDSVASALWCLVCSETTGVFHVGGSRSVSRYEFASLVADVFSLNGDLLKPVASDFFPNIAPRPKNTTLSTMKIQENTAWQPDDLRDSLESLRNEYQA
jgi:dTDP-4-dehydrorhamnose reductase